MPTSINDEEIAQLAQFLVASPDGVEREILFTKVGRHRRVLLAELTAYKARIAASRDEFLTRRTGEAAQKDEYFAMPDDHETR